jgi:hypothetical protein
MSPDGQTEGRTDGAHSIVPRALWAGDNYNNTHYDNINFAISHTLAQQPFSCFQLHITTKFYKLLLTNLNYLKKMLPVRI